MTTPAPEATPNQPAAPEAQAQQPPKTINWDEVPEAFKFLEKVVSEKNSEAARLRTERNELREKLASAKTPEEFEAIRVENIRLRRESVIEKYKIPEDVRDLLPEGDDLTALEAKAAKLAAAITPPAEPPAPTPTQLPPSGGSTPLTHPSSDSTGKDEYARWKAANKSL